MHICIRTKKKNMNTTQQDPGIRIVADKALWQRINDFSPDQPGIALPFSKKLAREQQWTTAFTAEAIAEYKKFVYLCCILPQGASPPHIIDEVWHMHLVYTQNYWEHFCEKVLQRKLHHHPSTGGRQDRNKHELWQRDTLTQYQVIFGTAPPSHIWQDSPPAPKAPIYKRLRRALRLSPLLLLLFILPGCNGTFTPVATWIALLAIFSGIFGSSDPRDPKKKHQDSGGSSCSSSTGSSCSSSSCGSSCGSGCGGGCGGCGGS